jgi:hypothetical protein
MVPRIVLLSGSALIPPFEGGERRPPDIAKTAPSPYLGCADVACDGIGGLRAGSFPF